MNILILGGGGREHALAWKISQSPLCTKLYIAPGNAGTALCGENVDVSPDNFPAVGQFAVDNEINMVIVGPEEPLVKGIADFFSYDPNLRDIAMIGPGSFGAMLEGSKAYAKNFMKKYDIPTAQYQCFDAKSLNEGLKFLETFQPPYVLKADGLAAGKGVIICHTVSEAKDFLKKMLDDRMFGDASNRVVVEQYLEGKELSVFVATDGKSYIELPSAKDYKRIGEGDTGPNTGGMGCVSPVTFADEEFMKKVREKVIEPTIMGLDNEQIDYKGFIFFGLMNMDGEPYVIEYNVRLGDPEAEVILPRINSDIVELFKHLTGGTLENYMIKINQKHAAAIMLVSGGYPGSYQKGYDITGIDELEDSMVFYAGAKLNNGVVQTSGGRVLAVTSLGDDLNEALKRSRSGAQKINFTGKYFRSDIGNDLI